MKRLITKFLTTYIIGLVVLSIVIEILGDLDTEIINAPLEQLRRYIPLEQLRRYIPLVVSFLQAIRDQRKDETGELNKEYFEARTTLISGIEEKLSKHKEDFFSDTVISLSFIKPIKEANGSWQLKDLSEAKEAGNSRTIRDIFKKSDGRLLILGAPGSGKTGVLTRLAKLLLNEAMGDINKPLPLILNLSSWGVKQKSIEKWIFDQALKEYQREDQSQNKGIIKRWIQWIRERKVVLLLDGLDEVNKEYRSECVSHINSFLKKKDGKIRVVVCCRLDEYVQLGGNLISFDALLIEPLTDSQMEKFVESTRNKKKLSGLIDVLRDDDKLREIGRTPLMLKIMVMAFEGKSSHEILDAIDQKGRRASIFESYIKQMFKHKPLPKSYAYSELEALRWLRNLAKRMPSSSFSVDNLQPEWLPHSKRVYYNGLVGFLVGGIFGGLIGLINSFFWGYGPQETLTLSISDKLIWALAGSTGGAIGLALGNSISIVSISEKWRIITAGGVSWVVSGLTGGAILFFATQPTDPQGKIILALYTALLGLLFGSLVAYKSEIQTVGKLTISIPSFSDVKFILNRGIVLGGVFWAIDQIIRFLIRWVNVNNLVAIDFKIDFSILIPFAILGVVFITVIQVFRYQKIEHMRTNQGLSNSRANILLYSGIVIPLITFLGFWLDSRLEIQSLLYAQFPLVLFDVILPLGLLYFGGLSLIQHYVLRLLLEREDILPFALNDNKLIGFLDDMATRLFLTRDEASYEFYHQIIREHFETRN